MTEPTLSALVWSEYDFARIDASLSDLARDLDTCTAELPTVAAAALRVRQARRHLRRTLALLDDEISSAVKATERLSPPPF